MMPDAGKRGLESSGSCGLLEYIMVHGLPVVAVPVVGEWGRLWARSATGRYEYKYSCTTCRQNYFGHFYWFLN